MPLEDALTRAGGTPVAGEHLLLIGNQGVGKNKLADRFLQLLKLPREYIQLHRYGLDLLTERALCACCGTG